MGNKRTTLEENGKLRGQEILDKYGREHFEKMGRKSIAKQKKKYGKTMFSERGKKAAATRLRNDPHSMQRMRDARWGKKSQTEEVLDLLLGKS